MTSVSLDFALQSFQFAVTRHFDEFSANYDKWSNFLSKVPELYNRPADIFVTLAQLFVYKFTVLNRRDESGRKEEILNIFLEDFHLEIPYFFSGPN